VTLWLLSAAEDSRPMSVGPHPDWPDRLRVVFRDDRSWLFWIALFDGSSYAATHTQDGAEWVHSWTSHDGNVFLQYRDNIDPLAGLAAYPDSDPYDPRD
jgi:hypothetical protein